MSGGYGCGNPFVGPCVPWEKFATVSDARVAAESEVERLRGILNEHKRIAAEGPFPRRALFRGNRLNILVNERDKAQAAVDRVVALCDEVDEATRSHAVSTARVRRAIDGVQPPRDGDETAGQDRRTQTSGAASTAGTGDAATDEGAGVAAPAPEPATTDDAGDDWLVCVSCGKRVSIGTP